MFKLIIKNKYDSTCFFWENLVRKNTMPNKTVDELINEYGGFEGEISFTSLSKNNILHFVEEFSKSNESKKSLLLLVTAINKKTIPTSLKDTFIPIGYDFGICEKKHTIYSSIFNEILFGSIEKLVHFKNSLNKQLLFPTQILAKSYARLHLELLNEGIDVENDKKMKIYEIWKYKN